MNKNRVKTIMMLVVAIMAILFVCPQTGFAEENRTSDVVIKDWEIQWFNDKTQSADSPSTIEPWVKAGVRSPITEIPKGYNGAWVHIVIPATTSWKAPGLLISQMSGLDISIYENKNLLYHSTRDFSFDRNMVLTTLTPNPRPSNFYIRITSLDRAGVISPIRIGDYNALTQSFITQELPSLMLGSSVAFVGLIMLLISGYLNSQQRKAWVALSLMALATSIMISTYSTLPYTYFEQYGKLLQFLFDVSMLVVFPALHLYTASIFEGKLLFYRTFGRWFAGYSAFCFLILILNECIGDSFYFIYKLFTFYLLAPMLLIHLFLVLSQSVIQSVRGNKNSLILAMGFLVFTMTFVVDLFMVFISDRMKLNYLWKFGIVLLIISLIIVLARRISADYKKLVSYSKELELFNGRLQREEKLKFISELAASIAHEVRNPLQVTRGFLQLISGKSDEQSKMHFSMAISELDRASTIITDFLTFAKPELDNNVITMDIQHELQTIETIISPMAALSGAALQVDIPNKIYVIGNPSKFKQAIMNMVKNSIEAIQSHENGIVGINVHEENGMAVIRISDNGEGMEAEQIAKLGEPYYSTKTKGTGLGLMVTFRIIEVMEGTLQFRSEKGKGTEALIRFPIASEF
ncbi:signal transduction histidine kinase [Paenibacillus cellulosilyticus]|uniref:histidine kinase n=1 Tax=Paenibacillus cellulosilyticus TaxID=375489 RepID=A0A2V2Z4A9_9BACL|nr:sensor histidine kinase [Paenibacillus cellulosilyticus]PWW05165.1 signal transduction histidine kinase [Paenibacillus cellulosilyticus]QKS48704.1 ATP-binding protein [Paenibacillus cellulosilyticus]